MGIIRLPIDTKSLYFNIKNDNLSGHTATVASPLKKTFGEYKLEDVTLIKEKELDIASKNDLVELLVKHSKTQVVIRKVYEFNKIAVNGKFVNTSYSFGCYIKEEIDETKAQFGRLKLHYPSKFIYENEGCNINNKEVYKEISRTLGNYAFLINFFEYNTESGVLNFDALIVGENDIPYSKVFINEKGVGNKFNLIFNESADDYDKEIISLRKKYGEDVGPHNYLEYFKKMKEIAVTYITDKLKCHLELIYLQYPYSLFDFYYIENGVKKYGVLRVTATKQIYFNISFMQQMFMARNKEEVNVFLVSNIFEAPVLNIYKYDDLSNLDRTINSMKYEEESL